MRLQGESRGCNVVGMHTPTYGVTEAQVLQALDRLDTYNFNVHGYRAIDVRNWIGGRTTWRKCRDVLDDLVAQGRVHRVRRPDEDGRVVDWYRLIGC